MPATPRWDDDFYQEKLDIALKSKAAYVSFTFGHPEPGTISRFQESGKKVVLYATSRAGIDAVLSSPADVLGIQGPGAGGHRASVPGLEDPLSEESLESLLEYARTQPDDRPVIAGGGVAGPEDIRKLLEQGAWAVQVGTLFLLAREAGTKPTHRHAIRKLRDRKTVLTQAFTGKYARAVSNGFIERYQSLGFDGYPEVHYLTHALRKEAAEHDDPENLHLWAGTGFAGARPLPTAEIVQWLCP